MNRLTKPKLILWFIIQYWSYFSSFSGNKIITIRSVFYLWIVNQLIFLGLFWVTSDRIKNGQRPCDKHLYLHLHKLLLLLFLTWKYHKNNAKKRKTNCCNCSVARCRHLSYSVTWFCVLFATHSIRSPTFNWRKHEMFCQSSWKLAYNWKRCRTEITKYTNSQWAPSLD